MRTPIQVLRLIRMELFRTLLMERVEFFDRHTSTELTSLLSIELDSLRSFIFGNVSRDRGLRAILEASGAVLVRLAYHDFTLNARDILLCPRYYIHCALSSLVLSQTGPMLEACWGCARLPCAVQSGVQHLTCLSCA